MELDVGRVADDDVETATAFAFEDVAEPGVPEEAFGGREGFVGVDVGHDGLQATDESREARLFFLCFGGEMSSIGLQLAEGALSGLDAGESDQRTALATRRWRDLRSSSSLEVVAGVESAFQIFAEGLAVGFVAESHTARTAVGIAEEVLLNGGRGRHRPRQCG